MQVLKPLIPCPARYLIQTHSLLSPIGQHRENHVEPSKGKRSKKRKRKEGEPEDVTSKPPTPEISSFILLGLNSVIRHLEGSSRVSKPKRAPESSPTEAIANDPASSNGSEGTESPKDTQPPPHLAALFLPTPPPQILQSLLPQLVTTASLAHPSLPQTRLVTLPPASHSRISSALGVPRVSFIGLLEGAPHSGALVEIVRECVGEIEVPVLKEGYLPVKINAIETLAPPAVVKEKKGN